MIEMVGFCMYTTDRGPLWLGFMNNVVFGC